jgi:hypothetical protein
MAGCDKDRLIPSSLRAVLSIRRHDDPSLRARSSATVARSSGSLWPKGRVWSRGMVGAGVWPVSGAGPALDAGEAARIGARAGNNSSAGCSVSLPLPLRSELLRRSGRAVVVGGLRRREDTRNSVSTPERHRPVAFSIPGAGEKRKRERESR